MYNIAQLNFSQDQSTQKKLTIEKLGSNWQSLLDSIIYIYI